MNFEINDKVVDHLPYIELSICFNEKISDLDVNFCFSNLKFNEIDLEEFELKLKNGFKKFLKKNETDKFVKSFQGSKKIVKAQVSVDFDNLEKIVISFAFKRTNAKILPFEWKRSN